MTTRPLVSIIMNCYNGEKYLKFALSSVLKQTFKNWELIFIDNNSRDKSKKIFKSYSEPRFKYFFNKTKTSLYKARNLALAKTKGSYISFLDVDDMWDKNKLMIQLKKLKQSNLDFVYSNYNILKNNKLLVAFKKKKPEGYIGNYLAKNYFIPILTVLFKKKLLKKKIKFNNYYNIIGDFDLFLKLSFVNKFAYIHRPLATYRMHSDNFSLKNTKFFLKEFKYWLNKNKKKYSKEVIKEVFLNSNFLKIKILIFNSQYKKAFFEFLKFPFSIKKLKLLILFFSPKKIFNF